MPANELTRLGDGKLIQSLMSLVRQECVITSELLAHLAEVDHRRLYVRAGYPSMFEYCVRELGFSEGVAYKRIQAARAARSFAVLFDAVADGRIHLAAILLLAPYLTKENARELIEAASRKRKSEIVELLAARFPKRDVPDVLRRLPTRDTRGLAPAQVASARSIAATVLAMAPPPPCQQDPDPVGTRQKVTPLAPERYALQATLPKEAHDTLQRVRELLSHQVPSGDLAAVLAFCLQAGLEKLEKRKFAATSRPHKRQGKVTNKRAIPAHVKRDVWSRDEGRCTFVSGSGKRCNARSFLEFDHIEPVARGGLSTRDNTRLRCRAHNQYAAELVYGSGFMHEKRERGHPATR